MIRYLQAGPQRENHGSKWEVSERARPDRLHRLGSLLIITCLPPLRYIEREIRIVSLRLITLSIEQHPVEHTSTNSHLFFCLQRIGFIQIFAAEVKEERRRGDRHLVSIASCPSISITSCPSTIHFTILFPRLHSYFLPFSSFSSLILFHHPLSSFISNTPTLFLS